DSVVESVDLGVEEARTLAAVLTDLGFSRTRGSMGAVIDGRMAVDWVAVPDGFEARTIEDLAIRSQTGASVVAVIRDGDVDPTPQPGRVIESRDTVVVIGTPDAIEGVFNLLAA
ncbi:MAG: cation:proton antiporter regulatory subunit, partial [Acidimicrobiales bacterium]